MTAERSSGQWCAEWIRADTEKGPAIAPASFQRVQFRRRFLVEAVPEKLDVHVSADSRYVLWLNGTEIGRGPARSQPYRWTYDSYDLAAAMKVGENVVAVLVTYYGHDNAVWQRAKTRGGLGACAALILDAPDAGAPIGTGEEWEARIADAWSDLPPDGALASLPIEILDQRALEDGWNVPGHAAGRWPAARLAHPHHPGGSRRARPPVYPFGRLVPRPIAPLGGAVVAAEEQEARRVADPGPGTTIGRVHAALASGTASPRETPPWSVDGAENCVLVTYDFGRVVAGLVEFDFDAPADTVFEVAYLERPPAATVDARYLPRAGARITARGGAGAFGALETNGLRVVAILVSPGGPGHVHITDMRVREHLCPFTGDASFASSDAALERLWRAGIRTVQVNSADAFTDCPTREQRSWVGDGVVHLEVHLVANEDWRLAARYLELSDSPRPDGILPMSAVGDIESAGGATIPDWSLHWVHALYLYAGASKDAAFVAARMPTAQRIVRWFDGYLVDGVLNDVPEWVLVDWSSVFVSGGSSIITALWARALREFAELCHWLGDPGTAAWAEERVVLITEGYEVFWDADRGLYVDHVMSGVRMPAVSQAANAAPIVARLVPRERVDEIVSKITDEARLVDRGWNAASPTVSLEQKIQDRADGMKRIDWDVHEQIVRAEPFFSAVVHDAIAEAGHAQLLPRLLARWQRFLTDGYDTFGECWGWGTPAHGWSSAPTRDIVRHVLGVQPRDLHSDVYVVAPARTGIEWMRAAVPTHRGLISVVLDGACLDVDSPVPIDVVTWDGTRTSLPPGGHRMDLAMLARANDQARVGVPSWTSEG